MGGVKGFLESVVTVILVIVLMGLLEGFNIFFLVSIGICGSDCADKLSTRRILMFGLDPTNKEDFYMSLLVSAIVGAVTGVLNIVFSIGRLRTSKFGRVLSVLVSIGSFAVTIWFLVDHYEYWAPSDYGDALSSDNKHLFFCGPGSIRENKDCIKDQGMDTLYLMYYSDVVLECLFYIACGIAALGIVGSILLCFCSCCK